jgi:zinc protease
MKQVLVVALVFLTLAKCGLAQQSGQTPAPQSPASQGNQPIPPGPAQNTTHQPAQKVAPSEWQQIPIPPLPAFQPAVPKRIALPNGMVLFLQENHELPLISATARIRGGSRLEPPAKVGLVQIFAGVWRTGGTKTRTGDQMDDFLEARAAKLETAGDEDSIYISLNCLKQDFDDVWSLFLDLLHNPAFREDKLALAKDGLITSISRRNDDPGRIAAREAKALAYGRNNPYARVPEFATVAAVSRDDLMKWHDRFVLPNNIVFGIIGDFDSAQMEQRLRAAYLSWPKGTAAPTPDIKFTPAPPGLYYARHAEVNQSAIRMVALGIQRNNPDFFAVQVMNELFGGGFTSRLFRHIRTEQGLAYGVGGSIGSDYDHPGIFRLSVGTKTASTVDAIKSLNTEITGLLTQPASAEELQQAKDAILSSFIFRIDTPEKVLAERMAYEFYRYPLDFLEKFRGGVEKVTPADILRVARKYVHPGSFAVLVVGNDEAGKLLSSLGPVTTLDISIPPCPARRRQRRPSAASPNAKNGSTARQNKAYSPQETKRKPHFFMAALLLCSLQQIGFVVFLAS